VRSMSGFSRRGRKARSVGLLLCTLAYGLVARHVAMASFPLEPVGRGGVSGTRAVWMHSDETYESAYAWFGYGCQPPDFGSFAERYETSARLLAVVLDLTGSWYFRVGRADVYVWADDGGVPGEVLALEPDVLLGVLPYWPSVDRFFVELTESLCVEDVWWVGFWGRWPLFDAYFWVGADLDGPGGGAPMTKIAPGLEWPEGWQDVAVRFGPTAALGIGAEVEELPSPAESATWGAIKRLFQ